VSPCVLFHLFPPCALLSRCGLGSCLALWQLGLAHRLQSDTYTTRNGPVLLVFLATEFYSGFRLLTNCVSPGFWNLSFTWILVSTESFWQRVCTYWFAWRLAFCLFPCLILLPGGFVCHSGIVKGSYYECTLLHFCFLGYLYLRGLLLIVIFHPTVTATICVGLFPTLFQYSEHIHLSDYTTIMAVPWLRSLVTGLSPRRPRFATRSIHVGFVVDKVALGQVSLRVLRFSHQYTIPPSLSKLISSGECVIC
jgi:hypothetical protein